MGIPSFILTDQVPNRLEDEAVTTPSELSTQVQDEDAPHWFATSRSGKRVPYAGPDRIAEVCADALRVMGCRPEDELLNLNAPEPHMSGFAARQAGDRLGMSVYGKDFEDLHGVLECGEASDATVVVSIPSKSLELADRIEVEYGSPADCFPALRRGLFGGEALRPDLREQLMARWGLEHTREYYGSSEASLVAVGVDETRRLVPLLNHFILEIEVDGEILDIRECTEPTAGSILITDPDREAIDLVRYRQGDRVRVHPGGDVPRVEPLGRADDAVDLDGAIVHPADLRDVVRTVYGPGVSCLPYVRDAAEPTAVDLYLVGATADRRDAFDAEVLERIPALEHAVGDSIGERIRLLPVESADAVPIAPANVVASSTVLLESEREGRSR